MEKGSAVKCDLCNGDPACVRLCPSGAITLIVREEARKLIEKAF
jgi:Fe-S-cluster-containing hydrogenase component 2